MADVVTLDALKGSDPGTPDNSAPGSGAAGPNHATAQVGAAVDTALDEISRLQGLNGRYLQQINGAKQEVGRMRSALAEKEAQLAQHQTESTKVQQLEIQLAEMRGMLQRGQAPQPYDLTPGEHPADRMPAGQPPQSKPPEAWKKAMGELLEYDPDDEKLQQLWQAQASTVMTPEQVRAMLSEHQEQQKQQGSVGVMLTKSYPELADPNHPFTTRTMQVYQQLAKDPSMAAVFGSGMQVTDPGTGTTFNAALVMQAASMVRQEVGAAKTMTQSPTPGIGDGYPHSTQPPGSRPAAGVIAKGMADLLNSPELVAAAERAGLGRDPKGIWSNLHDKVSPAMRQQWEREAQTQGISFTRT